MKLVCGVGINDADYVQQIRETIGYVDGKQIQKQLWVCPFYRAWADMLKRSYSEKFKASNPTYMESAAIEEWHLFSTFKAWMEQQPWQGNQLDKDLLQPGNKLYSPDTCVFVSRQVNVFVIDRGAARGKYMLGVCWHRQTSKFMARCNNPFTSKSECLGYYASELGAHESWIKRKLELAYELAALQTDERVAKALVQRYANYRPKE